MVQQNQNKALFHLYFLGVGLFFVWLILGFENLNIYKNNWLLYDDVGSDLIIWLYFKNDIWRFPIGNNPNFGLDTGSSIAFTAVIPFFALIFKALKYIIPGNFHYFGFWIFLCFYLQSYLSYLLLKRLTQDKYYSLIGSIFFTLSPIFFNQLGLHLALAGHWIIILSFLLYCIEDVKKKYTYNIFLICFSSLVHFYFTIMLLIIYAVFVFCDLIDTKKIIFHFKKLLLLALTLLLLMYIVGYFEIPTQDTLGWGYGVYKLNLLGPIDPSGNNINGLTLWSRFIPDIPNNYGEHEGFSYLGIGQLLLFFYAIILFSKNTRKINIKKYYPYLLALIILTLLSLTNNIDVATYNLINLELNKYLLGLLSWIRASGRLFWPVYYFLFFFTIYTIYKYVGGRKKILLLCFALLIQIIDTSLGLKEYTFGKSTNKKDYSLNDPIWKNLDKNYKIVSSTYIKNQSNDFFDIIDFLKQNIIKTEVAYVARFNRKKLINSRYKNYQNFYNNNVNKNRFYIINNYGHLNHLKFLMKNTNTAIIKRDGIWLLLPGKANLMKNKDIKNLSLIGSKKITENKIFKFNFIQNKVEPTFLGLGWTKDILSNGVWTDGNKSTLLINVEKLKYNSYYVEFDIEPNILKSDQTITVKTYGDGLENHKFSFNKNNIKSSNKIKIKFNKDDLTDKKNLIVNFEIRGSLSNFDVLKNPDTRKLGLKFNSLIVKKI